MNQEILDKLKKILTLAADKGAQPGEVEAAIARAKALAIRHSIDLASVDLTQDEKSASAIEVGKDEVEIRSKYQQPYHPHVIWVLEAVFGVSIITHGFSSYGGKVVSRIVIIGEVIDVAIAKAVFPYLEKVFPATLSKAVSAGILTYCAAHTNGCYFGLRQGIIAANKREEEKLSKDDASKYALILVDKKALVQSAVEEEYPDLKSKAAREKQMNWVAAVYGKREGEKINLRQVGSGKANGQIK